MNKHSVARESVTANDEFQTGPFRASIVIPTLNRPQELMACLEALSVDFPGDAEVIVVSDGGDRARFPDISQFREILNLTVVHAVHGGPAHARNQGLQRANSPIIVFLDDDCLPRQGWLENMLSAVSLDPPVAVGGKTVNGLPGNVYSAAAQLVLDLLERDQLERCYQPVFFPSNNLAFPTAALRAINGFNRQFRTSEDRELCRRWLQSGYRLVKAPNAVIAHSPNLNFARYWRKYSSYGEGAARFHDSSGADWRKDSLAFHVRVPGLAAREISAKGLQRRLALYALLAVWEFANLAGFAKEKWRAIVAALSNRDPGGDSA